MTDAAGRLMTLVAYDSDGLPRPLLIDADGNLLISNQGGASGGSLKNPNGKLMTPVANDPDDLPRPLLVDADGYLKVKGAGGRDKIYDNIRTVTGNWDVASISQNYDNLEILIIGRSDVAGLNDPVYGYFNADKVNANYRYAEHYGGFAHGVSTGTEPILGSLSGATSPANYAAVAKAVIPSYALSTFNKIARCWSGEYRGGANSLMVDYSYTWANKNAINRLSIEVKTGSGFIAGSRLIIYGTY